MKRYISRIGFLILILGLFISFRPVMAEGGVIGTPPEKPDPAAPSLQYAGCGGQIATVYNEEFEQQVINLVNKERAKYGLTPLTRSEGLTNAARYQAADMSQDNYFSHDTLDRECGTLVKKCGPWERIANYSSGAIGENAAAGYHSPEAVMQGWMNSPGHRANILNPNTRAIGVGFYQGSGDYHSYWIQDFGTDINTSTAGALESLSDNLASILVAYNHQVYLPALLRDLPDTCQP